MPRHPLLRDVHGRVVPLARVPMPASAAIDGLGFLKGKKLKKFWNKYRKPIAAGRWRRGRSSARRTPAARR